MEGGAAIWKGRLEPLIARIMARPRVHEPYYVTVLMQLARMAKNDQADAEHVGRRMRTESWHSWCDRAMEDGMGMSYKYVKSASAECHEELPVPGDDDALLSPSLKQHLATYQDKWTWQWSAPE